MEISTTVSKCALIVAKVIFFVQLTPVLTLVSMPVRAGVESRRLGRRDEVVRLHCHLVAVNSNQTKRQLYKYRCQLINNNRLHKSRLSTPMTKMQVSAIIKNINPRFLFLIPDRKFKNMYVKLFLWS